MRGDTLSPDYLNWPVSQGAYLNELGKPFFLGTQTMFYSYTDGYPNHTAIIWEVLHHSKRTYFRQIGHIQISDFRMSVFLNIRSSTEAIIMGRLLHCNMDR
ncbi:MAG: hypothetical protein IPG99_14835 [Ignavibacteria bacterium]|nr:hypothetical protein [Ignavibacteria bacterium]